MNVYSVMMLIGIVVGTIVTNIYVMMTCKVAATLRIDSSDPDKDSYVFEVNVPLEELAKHRMIRVRIAHNTAPNMNN